MWKSGFLEVRRNFIGQNCYVEVTVSCAGTIKKFNGIYNSIIYLTYNYQRTGIITTRELV